MKTTRTITTTAYLVALALALQSGRTFAADAKPKAAAIVPQGASVEVKPKAPAAAATAPRPAWVDRPAGLQNSDFETKILVGPETSRAALDKATQAAVIAKISEYHASFHKEAPFAAPAAIDAELIDEVVREQWEEHVKNGDGESLFLHTQLRFDANLQHKWQTEGQLTVIRMRGEQLIRWFLTAMWLVAITHLAVRCDIAWAGSKGRPAAWIIAVVLAVVPFLG